jgi:DNA-directed RNA polymerase subunit beta'
VGKARSKSRDNQLPRLSREGRFILRRIFQPNAGWECSCRKIQADQTKEVICDRCGVSLLRVRRERIGHIELAVPVSHIWFKCMPSRIGLMLDMSRASLNG